MIYHCIISKPVIRLCNLIAFILLALPATTYGQFPFSINTDISLLRNFDGEQPITVIGQTVRAEWHIDNKSTIQAWFSYHSNGKYKTTLEAIAKSPTTSPQSFSFQNRSEMRLKQISLGIKRYMKGQYQNADQFSLYVAAGFGLIMGRASNNFSVAVDTSAYIIQKNVISGAGDFKRLSFDLATGIEFPVAYDIFAYTEARIHIPTTSYPNNYLLKNNNAPFLGSLNIGIRILFNQHE